MTRNVRVITPQMLEIARQRGSRSFVLTHHSTVPTRLLYRKLGGVEKKGDDLLFVVAR